MDGKSTKSVANITRNDLTGMVDMAAKYDIKPDKEMYSLEHGNTSINGLKKVVYMELKF